MTTTTAPAPPAPAPSAAATAAWHIAYLITGERQAAHRVVSAVLDDPTVDPRRLRAAVAARARAEARRAATAGRQEPLWDALQRLSRRERAAIVARLAA